MPPFISENTYFSLITLPGLNSTDVTLHTYMGESIVILGSLEADVSFEDEIFTLPLIVDQGSGLSLLGRNWLQQIKLNWTKIHATSPKTSMNNLLKKYISQIKPRFLKPCPVPYLLIEKSKMKFNAFKHSFDSSYLFRMGSSYCSYL